MFFNRFGPASDPYLRRICTPRVNTTMTDAPDALSPAPRQAPPPANRRSRNALAALSLAVAFAAPLCLGAPRAAAQEIEEQSQADGAGDDARPAAPAAAESATPASGATQ